MAKLVVLPFLVILLCHQSVFVSSHSCVIKSGLSGNITDERSSGYDKCWKIIVPVGSFVKIEFKELQAQICQYSRVEIELSQTGEKYIFCDPIDPLSKDPIIAQGNVTVTTYAYLDVSLVKLDLEYSIRNHSLECTNNASFRCSPHSCIPKYKVCDGVEDCENGTDELGCVFVSSHSCVILSGLSGNITDERSSGYDKCWKIIVPVGSFVKIEFKELQAQICQYSRIEIEVSQTGEKYRFCDPIDPLSKDPIIALGNVTVTTYAYLDVSLVKLDLEYSIHSLAIDGITKSRKSAISWLRSKYSPLRGWGANTARAVVALQLASGANFNGSDIEGELMAKQVELQVAEGLLRNSLSINELSTAVNSLLVTCHNPRRFYGIDLVKRLKKQVEQTTSTHPIVYLALCNAKESWPHKAVEDLTDILTSHSNYQFVNDIQAMAIMAVSCVRNHRDLYRSSQNTTLMEVYQEKIKHLEKIQQNDGSFGNVYTTAFIAQALVSSGNANSTGWKLNSTIRYLMKHLNSTSVDFLSTYLTLPLLNGKTLADISKIDCSKNPRKLSDPVSDVHDYIGPKVHVQYSLYIGDKKDLIHTITLLVPENYTALEVMELAEAEDPIFRFQRKVMSKTYVYEIAGLTNDPELGKFWLLYYATNSYSTLKHSTTNLEDLTVENGSRLVMWYRTATI